jgi:hypothetical protein
VNVSDMHVLQRVQPLHSTSKIDIDVSSFRCSFPSTVRAHTYRLPAHCTSKRAERQLDQGRSHPQRNPHKNPLLSTFDKSKIMLCKTTEDSPRQPVPRSWLRAGTVAGKHQARSGRTRGGFSASHAQAALGEPLWVCALLPAWLERIPHKAPICS